MLCHRDGMCRFESPRIINHIGQCIHMLHSVTKTAPDILIERKGACTRYCRTRSATKVSNVDMTDHAHTKSALSVSSSLEHEESGSIDNNMLV